jgi:hypothetical protein
VAHFQSLFCTVFCDPAPIALDTLADAGYDSEAGPRLAAALCPLAHEAPMTLEAYDPDRLDNLALRLLDLAVTVRKMGNSCRDAGLDRFELHDRKAQEWLTRLDDWARDSDARLQAALLKRRAAARALAPPTGKSAQKTGRKSSR